MAVTQKINFLTLVSYSLLQTVFSWDVPFRHNMPTKRHRQTTDRQTTQCAKGATDSTVGQISPKIGCKQSNYAINISEEEVVLAAKIVNVRTGTKMHTVHIGLLAYDF